MITVIGALLSVPVQAQRNKGFHDRPERESRCDKGRGRDVYVTNRNGVFYRGNAVKEAHAGSFKDLGGGYGRDDFYAYYNGKKIGKSSGNTFRVLKYGYAKDSFRVYYMGREVDKASANTFKVLDGGYAEDAFNTYYKGKRVSR